MEKKQLDFTAPLLSVRRRDLKVIHEKTVPDRQNTVLGAESDLNFDHVTKSAAVPFVWEDIPGKARKELEGCNVVQNQARTGELLGSNGKGSCAIDNYDDGVFSQSTVSRDCSISSWSESDGHGLEPSMTFFQTHDFILRRFLPAAKAMTLELPCRVFKKQPLVYANELPTEETKEMVMSAEDQKPLLKRNDSCSATSFDQGKEEHESEPEVDHEREKSTIRLVTVNSPSFLPWFCIKSCSSLLNQVVDMQHATESLKSCMGEARRHNKSYRGPLPAPLISPSLVKDTIYSQGRNDATHTSKPNHARRSGRMQTLRRSSLSPNKGSHYRKKVPVSPRNTMGSAGIHKAADLGKNKTCDQKVTLGPRRDKESPSREKTLHVDLVKAFSSLHPPLPKSPSDPWLLRTLPHVPSRSSSPHSRKVSLTLLTPSSSTKWENIVKTSYLHRDRVRYSQELVGNAGKQRLRT